MEASNLKTVTDSTTKGGDFRPVAGNTSGWLPTAMSTAGPAPTAAPQSGTKLDTGMTAASQAVSNGQGSQYDGAPDKDNDDKAL